MIPKGDSRNIGGFRRRQSQAERDARLTMLSGARRAGVIEVRGGRKFRVLRVPDQYGPEGPVGGRSLREDEVDTLDSAE